MLLVALNGRTQGVDAGSTTAALCIRLGLATAEAVADPTRVVTVDLDQAGGREVALLPPPPRRRRAGDPTRCGVCHDGQAETLTEVDFAVPEELGWLRWSLREEADEAAQGWDAALVFPQDFWRLCGPHWLCQACLTHFRATGDLRSDDSPVS